MTHGLTPPSRHLSPPTGAERACERGDDVARTGGEAAYSLGSGHVDESASVSELSGVGQSAGGEKTPSRKKNKIASTLPLSYPNSPKTSISHPSSIDYGYTSAIRSLVNSYSSGLTYNFLPNFLKTKAIYPSDLNYYSCWLTYKNFPQNSPLGN